MKAFGPVIFFCTVIIGFVIMYERVKNKRSVEAAKREMLEREAKANAVRRKDITFLNYISIPIENLPFKDIVDEIICECQEQIKVLASLRIINLSGISNTDLKLEYGAANLPLLSEYDNNYILLVNTLSRWGARLFELDFSTEAISVLEYAVSIDTDVSLTYYMLADTYRKMGRPDEIERLIDKISQTNSIMTVSILKKLNEILSTCQNIS